MARRTRPVATEEYLVDDITGREIQSGGWELRGLNTGQTVHAQSLSELIVGLLEGRTPIQVSGKGIQQFVEAKGYRIVESVEAFEDDV
jgi:hypothetical protein